jgi:hypothetical protein
MAAPAPPQCVLVRHAGGTIKLPLLPTDSVQSLRRQVQLLGLQPHEAQRCAQHYVQLRDDQTMEQAGLLGSVLGVTMTKVAGPAAAAAAAGPAQAAAAGPGADAGATFSLWTRGPPAIEILVSSDIRRPHNSYV